MKRYAMGADALKIVNTTLRKYGVKVAADGKTIPLGRDEDLSPRGSEAGEAANPDRDDDLPRRVLDACVSGVALPDDDLAALISLFRAAGYEVEEPAMDTDAQADMIRFQRANGASAAMDRRPASFASTFVKEVTGHIRRLDGDVAEDRQRRPKPGDIESFYKTFPDARNVKVLD